MKISFIGGGNMAHAIISGLKNSHCNMSEITVIEPDELKRQLLAQEHGVQVKNTYAEIAQADVIVLAVKPQQLKLVCKEIGHFLSTQLVISIAAGVRSENISVWLNDYPAIVRTMPNTPAQIQAGMSALYAMNKVSTKQREQATTILASVGKVLWLDDESKMDAVTAISGSGPAYVFYFIEALEQAGIGLGLNTSEAKALALQTFYGASLLANASVKSASLLRSEVTSKGGTTEQGILALETANVKEAIFYAAQAAAIKSLQLGNEFSQLK